MFYDYQNEDLRNEDTLIDEIAGNLEDAMLMFEPYDSIQ